MTRDLAGRVALITGAARGIGARVAEHMAAAGARIYLADIDSEGAHRQAALLRGAAALAMDVRDPVQVQAAVDRVAGEQGGLDILVNNAGVIAAGPFDSTPPAVWNELVGVNLTGVYHCVQAAVPSLRRDATIINIASVSAEKGGGAIGNVWYGATKAGVVAITRGLARELGPRRVRVNAIAPGLVDTDLVHRFLTPPMRERALARFPLGRLTEKDDVARLAVFLASDAASFINGETIAVDGGFLRT